MNSGFPSGRGTKVFESVWIPKHRTIRLDIGLIGHPSKIQSCFSPVPEPQFKVESTSEQNDGTSSSPQNSTNDLPYLYRTKIASWFDSDLVQSLERTSNHVNLLSNEVNQPSASFQAHLNRSEDLLSVQKPDPKSTNQDGWSENYSNSSLSKVGDLKVSRDSSPCDQEGSFGNDGCPFNVLEPKPSRDSESFDLHGFLGRDADHSNDSESRQDDGLRPSNQEGSSGKCWAHSNVPSSSPSRVEKPFAQSEILGIGLDVPMSAHQLSPNKNGSCVKIVNRSIVNCSVSELESFNQDAPVWQSDERFDPDSNRNQSNEYANILEASHETSSCSDSGGSRIKKSNEKGTEGVRWRMSERTPFRCLRCKAFFSSGKQLMRHIDIHCRDCVLRCPVCGKRFNRRDRLSDHAKVHRKKSGPHSCERCGLQFTRGVFLERHVPHCPGY